MENNLHVRVVLGPSEVAAAGGAALDVAAAAGARRLRFGRLHLGRPQHVLARPQPQRPGDQVARAHPVIDEAGVVGRGPDVGDRVEPQRLYGVDGAGAAVIKSNQNNNKNVHYLCWP